MLKSRKLNLFLILLGALSGLPLSLIDDNFFDTERYLLVRAFIGGVVFSAALCFILDYRSRRPIRFGLDANACDLSRPYNSFFLLGLVIATAGMVGSLLNVMLQKLLVVPGFVFFCRNVALLRLLGVLMVYPQLPKANVKEYG